MDNNQPAKLFNKDSLLLIGGTFISKFGDVLYSMAIGIFIYNVTGSESLMGIFTSITMFITMFLSPVSGTIVDRVDRKMIIIGMNTLRGVLMLLIGYLCWRNSLSTGMLMALTVFVGLSTVLFQPAASTVLLDVVPKSELVRANSIISSFSSVADLISKGFSGFLLAYFGITALIIYNGIFYLLAAAGQCFITVPRTPKQDSAVSLRQIIGDLKNGLLALLAIRGLNTVFILSWLINMCSAGAISLMLLISRVKQFSDQQYGLLMALLGAGSLLGALLMSLVKFKAPIRPKLLISGFLLGCAFFCAGLLSQDFALVAAGFFLGDFFNIIGNVVLNSTMLLMMPGDKRATIIGFINSSSMGGFALSTLGYGFLAERYSIIYVALAGMALSTVFTLLMVLNKDVIAAVRASGEEKS